MHEKTISPSVTGHDAPLHALRSIGWSPLLVVPVLLAALIWSYWPVLHAMMRDWQADDNYSVGALVPFIALYLLWNDRKTLARCTPQPCGWGIPVILAALLARAFGLVALFESAERYSLVLMVAGLVLLIGGRQVFRRVVWVLVFLLLMVPLPGKVHNLVSGPLQSLATSGAVMTLELIGITVMREGHVMTLNGDVRVGVAEACSGLRMLTAFVVVAATFACVIRRPGWQRFILVCSSIPIAIVCNLVRAVVTALLFIVVSSDAGERFFHDFAGYAMMPLAILILVAELRLLPLLVSLDTPRSPAANQSLRDSREAGGESRATLDTPLRAKPTPPAAGT